MHPTSLPGPHGIGDLGREARAFVDRLADAKQGLWQVLPLGPTGYGDSPYACFSAFAGNPLLISPERLVAEGWLEHTEVDAHPAFPTDSVDFGTVIPWKWSLLARASERFAARATTPDRERLAAFRSAHLWLEEYALFMALKDEHGGVPWIEWPAPVRGREPRALAAARIRLAEPITRHAFAQWMFFRQWDAVRTYAHSAGLRIVGDLPIFVAYDSADVWANTGLFHLDAAGAPTVVAGVPPDYFSADGQRWGNPLYRWDVLEAQQWTWWIERVRAALGLYDLVRLDHFLGFHQHWEIPAGEPTAVNGRYRPGPGPALFRALARALGDPLPFIAEDLGAVSPEAVALRDQVGLPGMCVLQFGFSGPEHPYLPHHYAPHCVVYTGTHDNDTTRGWFESATPEERSFAQRYLARSGEDFAWDAIRAVLSSVADTAIVPAQDILSLTSEARMNLPGREAGNWGWRLLPGQWTEAHQDRLREMTELYSRAPGANQAGTP